MGKKPAQSTDPETAIDNPPPIPPTEIYPALDARLAKWIGPDAPYTVAARRLRELQAEARRYEGIVEFEARKLGRLLEVVRSPDLDQAMAAKWYDQALRQLLVNHLDAAALAKLRASGANDPHVVELLADAARRIDGVAQTIGGGKFDGGEFAGVMVFGDLVLDPPYNPWGSLGLFHADDWRADRRGDEDVIVGDEELIEDVRRILEIPTPGQAAAARKAAKATAKPAPAAKSTPAKPANKKLAAQTAQAPANPAAGAVGSIKLTPTGSGSPQQFKLTYRKDGHTRSKVFTGAFEHSRAQAATFLGLDLDDMPSSPPTAETQPPAPKKPAAKKPKPAPAAETRHQMGQKTGNPYVFTTGNDDWTLVDGTGEHTSLAAQDLRTARAEAAEILGMGTGGIGVPRCSQFHLFRPGGKGCYICEFRDEDAVSNEETTLEAAAWGAAIAEAAALFYVDVARFAQEVKSDKPQGEPEFTPADVLSDDEKAAIAAPLPSDGTAANETAADAAPKATVYADAAGKWHVRSQLDADLPDPVALDAGGPLAARIEAADYLGLDVDQVAIDDTDGRSSATA